MWKNGNNYTGNNQIVCWPCAKNGDMVFHLSTHIMGIIGVTDGNNDDVPYQSPSNQTLQATGLCLKDGSEVNLNLTQANLLNEQGIVTGLNFSGGWKSWGTLPVLIQARQMSKICSSVSGACSTGSMSPSF